MTVLAIVLAFFAFIFSLGLASMVAEWATHSQRSSFAVGIGVAAMMLIICAGIAVSAGIINLFGMAS